MSKFYTGSIDLSKIKKELIQLTDKNGQPFKNGAKYINVQIFVNETPDKFGNDMSIQIGGKDNKIYIGNAKEFQRKNQTNTNTSHPLLNGAAHQANEDGLPF